MLNNIVNFSRIARGINRQKSIYSIYNGCVQKRNFGATKENTSTTSKVFKKKRRHRVAAPIVSGQATVERILAEAELPLSPVSLKQLLEFGEQNNDETSIESARWLWNELPLRLARQVVALERLPFGLCLMNSVKDVRQIHVESFEIIKAMPEPLTIEKCAKFTKEIEYVAERHAGTMFGLAKGLRELREHVGWSDGVDHFTRFRDIHFALDAFYTTRIGLRMLMGQHIALFHQRDQSLTDVVGLIDKKCSPAEIAADAIDHAVVLCRDAFGVAPDVVVEGNKNLTFPYVKTHLFYMMLELLKNSLRATVEFNGEDAVLPDIKVIIAHSLENEDVAIKVADQGGGIARTDMPKIWSYMYTTAQPVYDIDATPEDFGLLAGIGYGLPISRVYARYFGGDLQVMSMEGYGTDAYLHLRRLGDEAEPLP